MNPKRKQRMLIILGLVSGLGVAVGLVMYALSQNINLFFTPTQIATGQAPSAQLIRVGGMVADGTVDRDPQSLKVAFDVTDFDHQVRVTYEGILPDLRVAHLQKIWRRPDTRARTGRSRCTRQDVSPENSGPRRNNLPGTLLHNPCACI